MADVQCEISLTGNVTNAAKLCHIPDDSLRETYPDLNDVPVNSYTCPVGQASGRAWLLLHRADLDVLTTANKAGGKDATYTLGMKAFFENVDEFLTIPNLVLVKAVRMNVGAPDDANALYLVELADKRLILETWADSGVIQANIRSHANDTDYLTGTTGAGSAMTWDELVELVWNKMSHILGTYSDTVTADGVPEGWDIRGQNAWSVLHAILGKLGKTVAYDPFDSTYSIVDLSANAQTIPSSYEKHLLRDAEPIEHDATVAPETIRVYFRTHYKSYGQERDTELGTNWQVESDKASTSKDVATEISGAVVGSVLQIWDDLPLVLDENNADDNDADLTTRANTVADAWLADAGIVRSMKTYVGFKADVLPGGTIKVIRWQNLNAGPMTLITQRSGFPSAKHVRGTELSDMLGSQEELQTPDLSRGSFPNFPRLLNIVEVAVTDGSPSEGDTVSPNADDLFPGTVQRAVAGVLEELEPCWIIPVDLEAGASPSESNIIDLRQGDKYLGRLSGIETSSGDTRPLYLVRSGTRETSNNNFYGLANENWQKEGDTGGETYSGTLTATNGLDAIVGAGGTAFDTEITLGTQLEIDGANYNVTAIADATNLTISPDFAGTSAGGYAVAKPALASTPGTPWIRVNPCDDIEGASPDFTTTRIVFWARFSALSDNDAEDPNVINQQAIGFQRGPDSKFFTEGYYNGKIGDGIFQTITFTKKQGWAIMDGTANGTDNGGKGFDMSCFFPRGSNGETLDGVKKGSKNHFHPVPISTTPETVQAGLGAPLIVFDQEDPTLCTLTNKDQSDCTCLDSECTCESSSDNDCKLPIEYVHLHYIERLDNSQGFVAP